MPGGILMEYIEGKTHWDTLESILLKENIDTLLEQIYILIDS